MIEVLKFQQNSERLEFLATLDFSKSTWVTSDLNAKFEIQNWLLAKQGFVEDQSVRRASEFWSEMMRQKLPKGRQISKAFALEAIHHFAQQASDVNGQEQFFLKWINSFTNILFHPQGVELLREWLEVYPILKSRIEKWLLISESIVNLLLSEGLVYARWIPAFLLYNLNDDIKYSRKLIFDLGAELTSSEVELIRILGRTSEVFILEPQVSDEEKYHFLKRPYLSLPVAGKPLGGLQNTEAASVKLVEHPSILSEVQWAVKQVKAWIDTGYKTEHIYLAAANIESYWSYVREIFAVEGVPLAKDHAFSLQNLSEPQQWLSAIKLATRKVSVSDLETLMVDRFRDRKLMKYEEFISLFSEIYFEADLGRMPQVSQVLEKLKRPAEKLEFSEFILWAGLNWNQQWQREPLELIIRALLATPDFSQSWEISSWIRYLENTIAHIEIKLMAGQEQGIQCVNLSSLWGLGVQRLLILGMGESQMNLDNETFLDPLEAEQIQAELGFVTDHSEQSASAYRMSYLLQQAKTEIYLSYPKADFSGAPQAPIPLWLKVKAQQAGALQEIQPALERHRVFSDLSEDSRKRVERGIRRDQGLFEPDLISTDWPVQLSASSLEKLNECPFIYSAQKNFRIPTSQEMDFELDPLRQGNLIHVMFEKIGQTLSQSWSESALAELIDSLKMNSQYRWLSGPLWRVQQFRLVLLAQRFIEAEKKWQKDFPGSKIFQLEFPFESKWNDKVILRGRIDRIDKDSEQQIVLIDYKANSKPEQSFGNWLPKNKFQLGLYSLLIDEDRIESLRGMKVVGAVYYNYKNFNRNQGLKLSPASGKMFEPSARSEIQIEQKEKFYQELTAVVTGLIEKIASGQFLPEPRDRTNCKNCDWRTVCRASHLNG